MMAVFYFSFEFGSCKKLKIYTAIPGTILTTTECDTGICHFDVDNAFDNV
jgi:hypothetical protein